jgi:hypothetical protein
MGVMSGLGLSAPALAAGDTRKPPRVTSTAVQPNEDSAQAERDLKEMSQTLKDAKTLRFKLSSHIPMQTANKQWITLLGAGDVAREGNDKLFVRTGGDLFPFELFYDGKNETAFAPKENVFASKAAPPSIDDLVERARARGENAFPFADVIVSDPYSSMMEGTTSGIVVGTSSLRGVETEHLAFRGPKIEWQIWIGKKDHLPRMAVITDLSVAAKPSHTLEFTDWVINGRIPGQTFAFQNSTNAKEVPFRAPEAKAEARKGTKGT